MGDISTGADMAVSGETDPTEEMESSALDERMAGEVCAAQVIDLLVERGADQLRENALKRAEKPFAAARAMQEMQRILDWAFLGFDKGEAHTDEPPPPPLAVSSEAQNDASMSGQDTVAKDDEGYWQAEEEPAQVHIDKWGRTVVKSKRKKQSGGLGDLQNGSSGTDTARSGQSRASTLRSTSRRGRNSFKMTTSASIEEIVVVEVSEPTEKKEKPGADIQLTDAERAYMLEMRAVQEQHRIEMEAAARKEAEERETKERWDKTMSDLKGKQYTFGPNGEVILINAIKPEKLPASSHAVVAQVRDRGGNSSKKAGNPKQRRRQKATTLGKALKTESKQYFTVSESLQPNLFEVMSVNSGVAVDHGGNKSSGPPPAESTGRMSKQRYLDLRNGASTNGSVDGSMDQSVGLEETQATGAAPVDTPQDDDDASEVTLGTTLDDRHLAEQNNLQGGKSRSGAEPEEDAEEDENLKLVNAPDWGQVGVYKAPTTVKLPQKPHPRVRQATVSPRSKLPRDRLAPEAITFTGEARRLPAPPLGASTGHGMPVPNSRTEDGQSANGDTGSAAASSMKSGKKKTVFPAINRSRHAPSKFNQGSPTSRMSNTTQLGLTQQEVGGQVTTGSPMAKKILGVA